MDSIDNLIKSRHQKLPQAKGVIEQDFTDTEDYKHLHEQHDKVHQVKEMLDEEEEPEDDNEERRFKLLLGEEDLEMLAAETKESVTMNKWARFDCFFGTLVVINGIMFGVTTDHIEDPSAEPGRWPQIVESVFLVFFCIEFGVRLKASGLGLPRFLLDGWAAFDFFIISISVVDNWILTPLGASAGVSMLAVLRVFRLMRLIRLVRLLKLLKELWLLVAGMLEAMRILGWSVLMLTFVVYIFALLLYEIVGRAETFKDDEYIYQHWGDLMRCMLTLVQIATYDGWGDIVRYLLEGPEDDPDRAFPALIIVFVIYITITAMGILNLIIGILLTSALEVTNRDRRYSDNVKRLKRHEAMVQLRTVLKQKCAEEGAEGGDDFDPQVTRDMISHWMNEVSFEGHGDSKHEQTHLSIVKLMHIAEITLDDVNLVFNEIESVVGQSKSVGVDDFIEGIMWLKGQVHALDVLHIMAGLRSLHNKFGNLYNELQVALTGINETSEQLQPILTKFHLQPDTHKKHDELEEDDKAGFITGATVAATEKNIVTSEEQQNTEEVIFAKFDLFFGVFVVINGAAIGVQADMNTNKPEPPAGSNVLNTEDLEIRIWYGIELLFLIIFASEFYLKAVLYYQVKIEADYRLNGICGMKVFPALAWDINLDKFISVAKIVPELLKDPFYAFDLFIILIAAIDLLILEFAGAKSGVFVFAVLRIFRLLRLLRLVRLLHLLRELWLLVKGLMLSCGALFWAMMMLLGVVYMGAIFMVELVGSNPAFQDGSHEVSYTEDEIIRGDVKCSHADILKHWKTLPPAMFTLLQIATFEDWSWHAKCINDEMPGMFIFFLAFLTISALGILNLVIGVMVQAAFAIVRGEDEVRKKKMLLETKTALLSAKARLFSDLKAEHQEKKDKEEAEKKEEEREKREAREEALAAGIDPDNLDPYAMTATPLPAEDGEENGDETGKAQENGEDNGWADMDDSTLNLKELQHLMEDKVLFRQLELVGLRVDQVLMVFQKLDVAGTGKVGVEEFIEGLLRMKQRVQGIDVAAAKSWMRRLVLEGLALQQEAAQCHECFIGVVEKLRGIQVVDHGSTTFEVGDSDDEDAEMQIHEKQLKLRKTNETLKMQIKNLRHHIDERKKLVSKAQGHDQWENFSLASAEEGAD